jgi:hypothetical protein
MSLGFIVGVLRQRRALPIRTDSALGFEDPRRRSTIGA